MVRTEADKTKKVTEWDLTSLLINEEKNISEIKYKTILTKKI